MSAAKTIARLGLIAMAALWAALAAGSAQAADASSNWAGYVAAPSAALGSRFSGVSGSWTEPAATCTPGHESYSAVWVGLGGSREGSRLLEQVGTDADCTGSGRAIYSSWFELLPAEAVGLRLAVHPGDRISASVAVRRHHATLRLRNLSTGRYFTVTKHLAKVDVSSAEWIVEAPSVCTGRAGACRTQTLTNFGEVAFSAAAASARGHAGSIADPSWSTTALELRQGSLQAGHRSTAAVGVPPNSLILAAPSPAGAGGAFAVRWQEQAVQGERSTPMGWRQLQRFA